MLVLVQSGTFGCRTLEGIVREADNVGAQRRSSQCLVDHRVEVRQDQKVIGLLIHGNAHLGICIGLQGVAVAVEVIGGDIEYRGHTGPEGADIVELKAADFKDPMRTVLFCEFTRHAVADVSGHADIHSCAAKDGVRHARGGCLSITSCNGDDISLGMAAGPFDLADELGSRFFKFGHNRRIGGDPGAFYR